MNKEYTLEEIKKEWKELGYKWSSDVDEEIILKMPIKHTTKHVIITISSVKKAYWKRVNDNLGNLNYLPFLFKEHQLLTKTFKALGWLENEENNRLTAHSYEHDLFKDIYLKLEELKNIEEELKIDFITLFKALRDGVFINEDGSVYKDYIKSIEHWPDCWGFITNDEEIEIFFEDYGVTWALTSEELELKEDE